MSSHIRFRAGESVDRWQSPEMKREFRRVGRQRPPAQQTTTSSLPRALNRAAPPAENPDYALREPGIDHRLGDIRRLTGGAGTPGSPTAKPTLPLRLSISTCSPNRVSARVCSCSRASAFISRTWKGCLGRSRTYSSRATGLHTFSRSKAV